MSDVDFSLLISVNISKFKMLDRLKRPLYIN